MDAIAGFTLAFEGESATLGLIDFYDVAEALVGFERSLAITTQYVLNGSVITQAPALKGAQIFAMPPERGSWKIAAYVVPIAYALSQINAVPRESPLGNLIYSSYDYVISETLGFHVDFSKTLGVQYEEYKRTHITQYPITESGLDSVIEKCDTAIRQMHRPVVKSSTAEQGLITQILPTATRVIRPMNLQTYEYINEMIFSDAPRKIRGRISSYNINTYKGRIFCFDERRPIPFILEEITRNELAISRITSSLASNAISRSGHAGNIEFTAYVTTSKTGTVKRYHVISVDSIS